MKIFHEMKAFLLDNIYKMYETLKGTVSRSTTSSINLNCRLTIELP